jgi:hypothetical protein
MEVPMGEESAAEAELRESILESLTQWSRSFRVRMLKKVKERRIKHER